MQSKSPIPNATLILVLGICSILLGCALVGLALGITGLILASKARALVRENPDIYQGNDVLQAGYVLCIVGTVFGGLSIIYIIVWASVFGGVALGFLNSILSQS